DDPLDGTPRRHLRRTTRGGSELLPSRGRPAVGRGARGQVGAHQRGGDHRHLGHPRGGIRRREQSVLPTSRAREADHRTGAAAPPFPPLALMAQLTFPIVTDELLVDVRINLAAPDLAVLRAANQPAPASVAARAILDTGSNVTGVAAS